MLEFLSDPVFLARVQFAFTAAYHFVLVPLTIGLGLILAINGTRYYRSRSEEDASSLMFWTRIFTVNFALGVASGITLEFAFGANWADYSRFVGDIFGAPLAAEALLSFFMESVFLGIVIFGRKKVSPKAYLASCWLVWFGSCLSALWIIIANSWMQTPGGAELSEDGASAILTDFFAAAFNASTLPRYSHVFMALIIMGAFASISIAAFYMHKGKNSAFAMKTMRIGAVVGIVSSCLMLVTAHASAVTVANEQPTKFAMMEAMYEDEVPAMYVIGWVDEDAQTLYVPIAIPGGTSFLASGKWDTVYAGLYSLSETEEYGDIDVDSMPVNTVFQSYHLMVAMYGLIMLTIILVLIFTYKGGKIARMRWLQKLAIISPLFPFIAIEAGWFTAEIGRQPYVVYPSVSSSNGIYLLTDNGVSASVTAPEVAITLVLFIAIYVFLAVAYARIVGRFIADGPSTSTPATVEAVGEGE